MTRISSSGDKEEQACRLGAGRFIAASYTDELERAPGAFDFILSIVSADLLWDEYLGALRPQGELCIVGVPESAITVGPISLLPAEKAIAGGIPGSLVETAQMLDFTARHGIKRMVETFARVDANRRSTTSVRERPGTGPCSSPDACLRQPSMAGRHVFRSHFSR